jgi:hypothetical protein
MEGGEDGSANTNASEAARSGRRVMVLAQEGLDMMTQVSRVVNDTLVSAEGWCEKLGRRRDEGQQPQQQQEFASEKMETESRGGSRSETVRSETLAPSESEKENGDIKMTM